MTRFTILTYNNYVGIVTDAILLKNLIESNTHYKAKISYIDDKNIEESSVGIWIQNFNVELLNKFKHNIFFINEEWASHHELSHLNLFDTVICKSKYAKKLLEPYYNVVYLPFISHNFYDSTIARDNQFLHFLGKSIQKNTELVLKQNVPLTLIDPGNRYTDLHNGIKHINSYQPTQEISNILNSHNTHICISLYESWGHYLFEGLSTGAEIICSDIPVFRENLDPDLVHFLPTIEKIDKSYLYCSDNKNNIFPLRKSFFIDESTFKYKLQNFIPIGKNRERRFLFKQIVDKNKKDTLYFFNNI